jgi:negative regulator of sigma E activity
VLTKGFSSRVNRAIDGEPMPAAAQPQRARSPRWWRPLAGVGVAAGVAAIAIVALQQRAAAPSLARLPPAAVIKVAPGMPVADTRPVVGATPAPAALTAQNREALSYTVPVASAEGASVMAPARLTNYVFAHSKYSSGLGQRGVLADMLIEEDAPAPVPAAPVKRAAQ